MKRIVVELEGDWVLKHRDDEELPIAKLKSLLQSDKVSIENSCDEKALWYPPLRERGVKMETFPENRMLSLFEDTVHYGHWYFGHYHMDSDLTEDKTVLYQKIVALNQ